MICPTISLAKQALYIVIGGKQLAGNIQGPILFCNTGVLVLRVSPLMRAVPGDSVFLLSRPRTGDPMSLLAYRNAPPLMQARAQHLYGVPAKNTSHRFAP